VSGLRREARQGCRAPYEGHGFRGCGKSPGSTKVAPSAAKAALICKGITYGLKAVPFKKLSFSAACSAVPHRAAASEFFSSEVRVSLLRSERNLSCNNLTSAAKAAHAQEVYGTAEAVPFVQNWAVEVGQVYVLREEQISESQPFGGCRVRYGNVG